MLLSTSVTPLVFQLSLYYVTEIRSVHSRENKSNSGSKTFFGRLTYNLLYYVEIIIAILWNQKIM